MVRKSNDYNSVESIKIMGKDIVNRNRKSDDNNLVKSKISIEEERTNRVNDDLNESFQDLNPDNDIIMFDQLLQLQRKD